MRNIKFLNMFGDIVISWDKSDDKVMEQLITQKLNDGYQFFIVEKKFFGLMTKEKKVKTFKDISQQKIMIKDKDMEQFFEKVKTLHTYENKTTDASYNVKKIATTAKEVIKSSCVCTKRPVAG